LTSCLYALHLRPPPQTRRHTSPPGPVPPSSRADVYYPLRRNMHAASSLHTAEEVHRWRGGTPLTRFPPPTGQVAHLQPLSTAEMPHDPIEQVILRRGSTRKFARAPISLAQ